MEIKIGQSEIKEAVMCYLDKRGLDVKGFDVDLNIVAGRSGESRIEITLEPMSETLELPEGHPGQTEMTFGAPATAE